MNHSEQQPAKKKAVECIIAVHKSTKTTPKTGDSGQQGGTVRAGVNREATPTIELL